MKCPKCGYISFDYNQVCPKCNKNIIAEQIKFNLPSFRPDPPALLGFLIGEANESNINLRGSSGSHNILDEDIGLNDSVIIDHGHKDMEDQDLDISLEPEESEEDLFEEETPVKRDKSLSDSDFRLETKEGDELLVPSGLGEEEEISLDLEDLSLEGSGEDFDKSKYAKPAQGLETEGLESLDSLPLDIDSGLDELESEIELDLDDLKVSDIGNLEVGADIEPLDKELEKTLAESEAGTLEPEIELSAEEDKLPDISELILEEPAPSKREKTIVLNDFAIDDSGQAEKEEAFEFGDVELGDSGLGGEESLNPENLNMEEDLSGDLEHSLGIDDLGMNDSAELEKSFDLSDISLDEDYAADKKVTGSKESLSDSGEMDLDLDAMSLDVEEYQKVTEPVEDFDLDLDDMDIDLDLNEPKKKS